MAFVYGACSPSGKIYIGFTTKTVEKKKRWIEHVKGALCGERSHLNSAIRKHSPNEFVLITLAQGISVEKEK